MSSAPNKPQVIDLTAEKVEQLRHRISTSNLPGDDQSIMLGLLSTSLWLHDQLRHAKLTITKLKKFFGFRTEKKTLQ